MIFPLVERHIFPVYYTISHQDPIDPVTSPTKLPPVTPPPPRHELAAPETELQLATAVEMGLLAVGQQRYIQQGCAETNSENFGAKTAGFFKRANRTFVEKNLDFRRTHDH